MVYVGDGVQFPEAICSTLNKAFIKLIASLVGVLDNPSAIFTRSGLAPVTHNFFPSNIFEEGSPNQHPCGIKKKELLCFWLLEYILTVSVFITDPSYRLRSFCENEKYERIKMLVLPYTGTHTYV